MTDHRNPQNHTPVDGAVEADRFGDSKIDVVELLFRLLEKWKYILLAALLGAVLSGVYTLEFIKPVYEATAKLYVMNSGDSAINLSDLQIGSYLASDYQEVFKTWEVHEMVLSDLHLNYTYAQMQSMLKVSNPSDTRILYISVSSSDPQEAVSIANEYAAVAKRYISKTMATEEPNILSSALLPTRPVRPNRSMNVVLGLLAGALLAISVIVARFVTDDKLKTVEDVRNYVDLPTLAIIPNIEQANGKWKNRKGAKRRR
jgi:capsular polysaccharide biosynthesis protein